MSFPRRALTAAVAGATLAPFAFLAPAWAAGEATPPAPRPIAGFCPADGGAFTDTAGSTFAAAISCLAATGVTQGGPGGLPADRYAPDLPVNRDAMASFLVRLADAADVLDTGDRVRALPDAEPGEFTDVPEGNVHAAAIARLAEAGIVQGGPGGAPATAYGPALRVTRAQMASFVARTLAYVSGREVASGQDFFVDDESSTAHEAAINALAERGIAVGDGASTFSPMRPVLRGQMAGFLSRALALLQADGAVRAYRPDFTLTLLHANDLESALLPVTAGDPKGTYGGADRFVALINQQQERGTRLPGAGQAAERGVLTVSAGDNFLPGPNLAASQVEGAPNYDALAFSAAGFDVSIIGNHEFDLGPDFLADWLVDVTSDTAFVSNNLGFEDEPALLALVEDGTIVSSHVEEYGDERVGVIGLTTPDLAQLSSSRGVTVDPALAAITNAQAAAYAQAGVDKVVLVSHLQDVSNELALVPQLRGVDLVVSGGGHELLADAGDALVPNGVDVVGSYPLTPTDADGDIVPVVSTAALYTYVGRLVTTFDADGELLRVHHDLSRPIPVAAQGPDAVEPDAQVREQVVEPVQEYVAGLAETVVAQSEVDLNGVRDDVRSQETNLGNLVTDALLAAGRREAAAAGVTAPVVALQNGGGIRNAAVIPAGDVTELDTYSILPFANFVAVAPDVPIETFVAVVERGLAGAVEAGELQPAGSFAQAAGYRVRYDPDQPAGSRVVDLVLDDGTVIVQNGDLVAAAPDTISVATIDFLLRGGDGYPFGEVDFTVLPVTYQQALHTYLVEDLNGVVSAAQYPEGGEGRITAVD